TIPEANGGRGNAASPDPSLLNKALGFSASISPNPANTWAAIDYTLPAGATKATLILTNALGVAVMTAELNGNQGQKVLDLRPLADGVYGYAVRCGKYVQNGKIVVTK
ncbi:MAG: T9SS type A sorting domain-containing protein, partial [Bacteroidales bacterium]|nr:T9SS type A sorting domain-containing protein [Bacteroidales bacterium]